jgi:hypothetical protein
MNCSALNAHLFIRNLVESDSIYKRKVRVIPVVDRKEDICIPDALRWVTYIPFDDSRNRDHLESLYSIVSGKLIVVLTQEWNVKIFNKVHELSVLYAVN